MKTFRTLLILISLCLATSLSAAEVTKIALSYENGSTVAQIDVKGPFQFTHQTEVPKNGKPDRMILDVIGATNSLANAFAGLPVCQITKIRTSQYSVTPEKVVRVVFDLTKAPIYQVTSEANSIRVTFTDKNVAPFASWNSGAPSAPAQTPAVKPAQPTASAPAVAPAKPAVTVAQTNQTIEKDRQSSLSGATEQKPVAVAPAAKPVEKPAVAATPTVSKPAAPTTQVAPKPVVNTTPAVTAPSTPAAKPAVESKPTQPATTPSTPAVAQKPVSTPVTTSPVPTVAKTAPATMTPATTTPAAKSTQANPTWTPPASVVVKPTQPSPTTTAPATKPAVEVKPTPAVTASTPVVKPAEPKVNPPAVATNTPSVTPAVNKPAEPSVAQTAQPKTETAPAVKPATVATAPATAQKATTAPAVTASKPAANPATATPAVKPEAKPTTLSGTPIPPISAPQTPAVKPNPVVAEKPAVAETPKTNTAPAEKPAVSPNATPAESSPAKASVPTVAKDDASDKAVKPTEPMASKDASTEKSTKPEPKTSDLTPATSPEKLAEADEQTNGSEDPNRPTARFRRSPVTAAKIKGTMVAEFPQRLVIKYEDLGNRDPFATLIDDSRTNSRPNEQRVPNVEGLKLVGIIVSPTGDNRALFADKAGYSYMLSSGDKVQKGYVLRVEADKVYFQIFEYGWSRTVALTIENAE